MMPMLRKIFLFAIFSLMLLTTEGNAVDDVVDEIQEAYDNLSPKGKALVGAGTGFVGSRIAVKGATTAVKFTGAAFVLGEVLNYSGLLDQISSENKAFVNNAKNSCLKSFKNIRTHARRKLSPNGIRNSIEKAVTTEKAATACFAAGAFVGFMV
mmetsp:Transcript_32964/g.49783  ORF Transcript_32964/g.49783 Transcript_32964/m.49783 type:complete len:154 (+) Transcript_32964:45-506(+)